MDRLLRSPWRRLLAGFALFLVGVGQCMEPGVSGVVVGAFCSAVGMLLAVNGGLELARGAGDA